MEKAINKNAHLLQVKQCTTFKHSMTGMLHCPPPPRNYEILAQCLHWSQKGDPSREKEQVSAVASHRPRSRALYPTRAHRVTVSINPSLIPVSEM